MRAHVGDDVFTPSPGLRTPDGGIREGDNWHSEEAVREENRDRRGTVRKLRKTKGNECRLKGDVLLDKPCPRSRCTDVFTTRWPG